MWSRLPCFIYRENIVAACCVVLYSSLKIVKSLQLHGRKQIAEPRKYCLVRVIVFFFFWRVFSLFFLFLTGWEFGEIPYRTFVDVDLSIRVFLASTTSMSTLSSFMIYYYYYYFCKNPKIRAKHVTIDLKHHLLASSIGNCKSSY